MNLNCNKFLVEDAFIVAPKSKEHFDAVDSQAKQQKKPMTKDNVFDDCKAG